MADIKSVTVLNELQDFLDKLPVKPCPDNPPHSDFCTVCKRLNREVAGSCKYSGFEIDAEKTESIPEPEPESVEFKPVSDDVETKNVVPPGSDDELPMIEIVKPTTTPKKPIEMELLDDVAIEFEVMGEGDEPVEVEALEVEPLEDDELGEESEDFAEAEEEVEVLQFEAVDEIEPGPGDDIADEVVFESTPPLPPGTIHKVIPTPPTKKIPAPKQRVKKPLPRKNIKLKKKPPLAKAPRPGPKVVKKPIPKPTPVRKARIKLKQK
jgi:hypothetical protein